MKTIKICTTPLRQECETMNQEAEVLKKYAENIKKITAQISIDSSTESIKKILTNISEEVEKEGSNLILLHTKLNEIISLYENADRNIAESDMNSVKIKNAQAETGENESNEVLELICELLGFIPVVNCAIDIKQIVEDILKLKDQDGEITLEQILGVGVDFLFLAMDLAAAGVVIKGISKGIKTVRVASAIAKKQTRTAATREVTAKAVVKKTAKNTGKKMVKKAEKAVRRAENAARRAEEAEHALKTTKRTVLRETTGNVAKETAKNVADKYVPSADNGYMPGKFREEARDQMIG